MRRLARFALPLLVFAAGRGAGAWFSISRRAADFSAGVVQRLAENADAAPAPIAKNARAFSSDEEMLTAMMSAVAEDEPLLRAHRLHDLLGRLGPAELAPLFDRVVRVEDLERRGAVLSAVLARWAALDPAGAAVAVRPYLDRFRATARRDWRGADTAVNAAWAQAQPEAALAEAMAAPDAPWAEATASAAIGSLAEGDPARQLGVLAHLPGSRMRDAMCENAIRSLAEKDTAAAEAGLELLTEPRQRARVQSEILGKLAERDATAALARLAALAPDLTPGTEGTRLVSAVLRAAAKKDPAAALAAVDGVPEELRTQALGAALVGWAGEHPVDALTWAAANGVDVAEAKATVFFGDGFGGSNSLLETAFENDHAKTLAWLRAQPVSAARDEMLRDGLSRGTTEERLEIYVDLTPAGRAGATEYVVRSLYQDNPQRAEAWAKAQPVGVARQAAITSIAAFQGSNAPERLDALADAWPAGADRDAALRGIVWSSYNEPQRGFSFARRVGDPAMREELLEHTARSWLYRDEPAARAWLAGATEFSAEQKRVLLRQFDER